MRSNGYHERLGVAGFLASTPTLVSAINVVVAGVLILLAQVVGLSTPMDLLVGVGVALLAALGHALLAVSTYWAAHQAYHPRFTASPPRTENHEGPV